MASPSYMNRLYGRHHPAMNHRQQQPFWPRYTLPAVAQHAAEAQGNPPAFIPGTNMPQMPYERIVMNGYGSYYQSTPNYYRNPVPYTQSDIGAPVPGWGTSVRVAGPARVGIGAAEAQQSAAMQKMVLSKAALMRRLLPPEEGGPGDPGEPLTNGESVDIPPEASKIGGLPWFVWPIATGVVMIGIGYYGTTKGWF